MSTLPQLLAGNAANLAPTMALLLPLLGFVVLALFGDRIQKEGNARGAGILACATVLTSFALSAWSVRMLYGTIASPEGLRFMQPWPFALEWIDVANLHLRFNLLLDPLSAVMILVVTGVGGLIHVYSLGYMAHDEGSVRYFSYLNLFTFFMLLLVLGGSLPLMFVGWEGVGLCSYLLIGFWYRKQSATDAGLKAFVVNRIGDAGLILGMILAFHTFGTLDLVDLATNAAARVPEALREPPGVYTAIGLLMFVGACGKSAQIPLHVWLPDAMEGPTPVSALIHAATMVTAGVYMVARLAPLYHLSERAMLAVAVVGTLTAFMGATIALVQTDIKKVLAYSTVSQLGYMFMACGVGAFGVGVFHLYTHAFFKALLFLGSGSVIHALSGEQDMRKMGGLWRRIPWTFGTFLVGTAAIAGVPFLAGFFSKDAILAGALSAGHTWLTVVGLITATMTAFYMTRLLVLTFLGEYRGDLLGPAHAAAADVHAAAPAHAAAGHGASGPGASGHGHGPGGIHESPWTMLLPLVLLAIGSIGAGYVAIPRIVAPALRLEGALAHHGGHAPWLMPVAILTAVVGIVGGLYVYLLYKELPGRLAASMRGVQRVLEAKWGFDLLYDSFVRQAVVGGSREVLWLGVDAGLIDGGVNGAGVGVGALAGAVRQVQTGLVRVYALVILGGAVVLLGYLVFLR